MMHLRPLALVVAGLIIGAIALFMVRDARRRHNRPRPAVDAGLSPEMRPASSSLVHSLISAAHNHGAEVTITPAALEPPENWIIHVRNWHYVPKDLFAADVRDEADEPLTDDDIDRLYDQHLADVEAIQEEQKVLLRAFIKLGVKRLFMEVLTVEDSLSFEALIFDLKQAEKPDRLKLLEIGAAGQLYRGFVDCVGAYHCGCCWRGDRTAPDPLHLQDSHRFGEVQAEQGILLKALAKQPNERYSSCSEFVRELRRSLD